MSFWDELRTAVRDQGRAGDMAYELYTRIAPPGLSEIALIRPTFLPGQLSAAAHDSMGFVEKLLDTPEGEEGSSLLAILYLRESARALARLVYDSSEPLEGLIQILEGLFEAGGSEDAEEGEAEEPAARGFDAERDRLAEDLRVRLRGWKLSDRVVEELSARVAQVYTACVRLAYALRRLRHIDPEDPAGVLAVALDLQYLADYELRRMLLEDVYQDEPPQFTVGLLPWISHFLEEMVPRAAAVGETPPVPA